MGNICEKQSSSDESLLFSEESDGYTILNWENEFVAQGDYQATVPYCDSQPSRYTSGKEDRWEAQAGISHKEQGLPQCSCTTYEESELRFRKVSEELQALKENQEKFRIQNLQLIIDGNNIGWRPINIMQDRKLRKDANKKMKSEGDKKPEGKMPKEKRKSLLKEHSLRRDKIIAQLKKENPTEFDDNFNKMFETAIVSCIHWIKEKFPDLKITLVLYVMNQSEKIQKLHDDQLCVIFYVKNKTDDQSILGLAKNIGENAIILSNDRFKDWTEKKYPGIYDDVVKNNLVGGYQFRKVREDAERYEFVCPGLVKKLGKLKKNK